MRNFDPTAPLINRRVIVTRKHETNEDEIYNLRHTIISGDVTYKNKDIEATASVNSRSSNIVQKVELVQSQV